MFASAFAFPGSPQGLHSNNEKLTNLIARGINPPRPYQSPGWIPYGQSLESQLSQEKTNGKSVLGTSKAPKLPHFLSDAGDSKQKRWDRRAPKDSDLGYDIPNTGVTRHYDFTVSELDISPDGVTRSGMVVSGKLWIVQRCSGSNPRFRSMEHFLDQPLRQTGVIISR